jgi:hypothetical protein
MVIATSSVIRQSTRGPKSKQKDLEMISVTMKAGKLSIEPVPTKTAKAEPRSNSQDTNMTLVDQPRKRQKKVITQNPELTRTTRSRSAASETRAPLPGQDGSVSGVFQKARKVNKKH